MKNILLHPLTEGIHTSVAIPGSKSYTNRALFLAAFTKMPVTIHNPLMSEDTEAMISCLKVLGVSVTKNSDSIILTGNFDSLPDKEYHLNANLSGTTIRFILALACTTPGVKILQGEEGLNKRPIGDLVDALRNLGAEIEYLKKENYPPIKITSSKLTKNETSIKGSTSSQFTSALLMVAPRIGGLKLRIEGEQISKPYINMTIDIMRQFGATIINNHYKEYTIPPKQRYECNTYTVEGDYSSAGYFAAIAALTNSTITLENMNPDSVQGDRQLLTILEQMGNKTVYGHNKVTIEGKRVKAVTVDMQNCPDQAQTLAVLAAFAEGVTHITGIKSLRVKETERIKALESELAKMGIKTESTEDSLTIFGGNPHAAEIDTYGDHRMAMSFAIAGAKLPGIVLDNPDVVHKTFPEYWKKLEEIGITIEENE